MSDMNTKDFLIGSLIGGIVGASAALFLAPKSGKELRSEINEQAQLAREKTSQFTSTAYDKGNEWASYAKDKSSSLAKVVSEQSAQVVDKVKEVTAKKEPEALDEVELASNVETEEGISEQVKTEVDALQAQVEEEKSI